jgi:cytochrome b561
MSFREKTAWAMALILIAGAIFYFDKVVRITDAIGRTAPPIIGLVIAYVVVIVIASVMAMIALSVFSPREADAPADEREERILDKAGHWSGYVLAVPLLGALWHFAVNGDGNMLFHLIFLALMLGQIAEYTFQIILFRRGA